MLTQIDYLLLLSTLHGPWKILAEHILVYVLRLDKLTGRALSVGPCLCLAMSRRSACVPIPTPPSLLSSDLEEARCLRSSKVAPEIDIHIAYGWLFLASVWLV